MNDYVALIKEKKQFHTFDGRPDEQERRIVQLSARRE